MTDVSKLIASLLLGGILLVYLSLTLYQIDLPGLHYDEAFEAVPAVQLLRGQPAALFRDSGWRVGGRVYPLMTQDYIGAINTYLALPFIMIFGATPTALRLMAVLVGAVTLGLSYAVARQLTGQRWVGLVAAAILAVDPTFVFWNRQGIFVTAVTAPIALAAVWCWVQRLHSGQRRWTAAGAFLFGLGLYAKVLFVWMIAALVGAAILLSWSWLLRHLPRLTTQRLKAMLMETALALFALGLGCWPLIMYNWQTGGTFLNVSENALTSYYGVNNLAVGANLAERFSQFIIFLNGGHLWYLGRVVTNWVFPFIVGVVFVLVVILSIRKPTPVSTPGDFPSYKVALFPFYVIALVICFSIATVSALWVTHFALLMPWPALAVALGSWFLLETGAASRRWASASRLVIGLGVSVLILNGLVSTLRYHAALSISGGLSTHSDAIYDLSDWLAHNADGLVVAMDWGLAAPITYLTNGQVTPVEVFGYAWQSDVQLTSRLNGFIAQPEALYLWRAPDEIIFDRSADFKALYRPHNLEETIEEAFYERSGRPVLGVTRLVDAGTASNPPQ